MQLVRSILFTAQIYLMMALMSVVFVIPAIFSRAWALYACRTWCRWVFWSASWMIGLKVEVRGTPPTGPALIAAKHQSFLDILVIYNSVPFGRYIMKRILLYAPFLGQFAWRIGCVFVNRGKRGAAISKMVREVLAGKDEGGQLISYPQCTRVSPGDHRPYKVGTSVLYEEMGQTCYPVATNVGLFWPKHQLLRKPGTAIIEYLEPIPPGLEKEAFLAHLEEVVETRSNELMAMEGFIVPPKSEATR